MLTLKKQLALETAVLVQNGNSRNDAYKHVMSLHEKRNDPNNHIQTGDSSDIIIYIDSSLNEPNTPIAPQIKAIAKELEKYFEYEITEIDDFDLK